MLKQQKKYPNPEEPCKVKFLLQLLSLSKIMRLATKHENHQASFRQLHSPPTPSFPMGKRCICSVLSLSTLPPDFPHCISPSNSLSKATLVPAATSPTHYPMLQIFRLFPVPPTQLILFILPAQV